MEREHLVGLIEKSVELLRVGKRVSWKREKSALQKVIGEKLIKDLEDYKLELTVFGLVVGSKSKKQLIDATLNWEQTLAFNGLTRFFKG